MSSSRREKYFPDRGDLIHMNFDPSAGHKMSGPHFAVVLSTVRFAKATGLCIVVTGTSKFHHDQKLITTQLILQLPQIAALPKTQGWVYTQQVRSIDYHAS